MRVNILFSFVYIILRCARNILRAPYFWISNPGVFVHHYLRSFVDGLINLDLGFRHKIPRLNFAELQKLLSGPLPMLHLNFENRYGNINFYEALSLSYLVQAVRPQAIFEIGTFDGYSTYHLAKNSPETCVVYTLNLPIESSVTDYVKTYSLLEYQGDHHTHELVKSRGVGAAFKNSDVHHKIVQLFGDSLQFDFAPYTNKIDLFFIDGGHSYEHVQTDTRNALQCLRPGGVIVWHDYNAQHREIRRYLDTLDTMGSLYHLADTRLVIMFPFSKLLRKDGPRS